MDVKAEVIEYGELFMEDVSDMMDEDLFDDGVLDSMGNSWIDCRIGKPFWYSCACFWIWSRWLEYSQ